MDYLGVLAAIKLACLLSLVCVGFGLELDEIRVVDSAEPVEIMGAKGWKLVNGSEIFRVHLGEPSKASKRRVAANKTKQCQEFDTHQGESKTSTEASAWTGSSGPWQGSGSSGAASGSSPSQTGQQQTSNWAPTSSSSEPPVGSKVVRQGSDVQCGEGNPNGRSQRGVLADRIIGGSKTEPGEFPFQVRLNIRSGRGSGICGGVILDERHILTAAHCMTACTSQNLSTATLDTSLVQATIGDHSIRANDGEMLVAIARITAHEKYDACNFYANDHDIALVRTSSPMVYRFTSDGYGSINRPCLPAAPDVSYADQEPALVSGWGVTRDNSGSLSNVLRYVQVPIVSTARCQETYGSRVTSSHLCAGHLRGGRDSCQGDSGGPLVRVLANRFELVGIVSFGYGCGLPGAPGVYTRVASYLSWIRSRL